MAHMTDQPDTLATHSADAYLLVEDLATGATTLMTLAEAEAITQIDRDEIEWALEAYGLCESMDHLIRDSRPSVEIGAAA